MKKYIKIIVLVILGVILGLVIYSKLSSNQVKLEATSTMIDQKEVQELYLANFTWNGIAEIPREKNKTTYIKYEAVIEARMDLTDINKKIEYNEETKEVYITLPKIQLVPVVRVKNGSFSYIPEDAKVDPKEAFTVCEEDAKKEATNNKELMSVAKSNAKNTIEGLLLPLIKEDNYKIVWKDGE